MPFLLHKLLPLAVLPIGFVLLMLILALIFRKRWMVATAAGVLYLLSTHAVSEPLVRTLENRYPRIEVADCPQADAIVVLGGVLRERLKGLEWAEAVDRFEQAVALKQAGKAPRLIFTGAKLAWYERNITEGEELREAAIARGIPAQDIFVTSYVATTAEEASAVATLAKQQEWQSAILVTSAFHMPRAVRLFRGMVPRLIPFPVDYRARSGVRTGILDFIPQAEGLLISDVTIKEYWGLLYYSLRRR